MPTKQKKEARPSIPQGYEYFLEGLADYFNTHHKYQKNDPRSLGWAIGQQMIAEYLVEILLQTHLERQGITNGIRTHNLIKLYGMVSRNHKKAIEIRYRKILNNETEWTWDVFRSIESFLKFLGKSASKKSRYPWQQYQGTLYSPRSYRPLIFSILIELFDYPYAPDSMNKRFDTEFKSLQDSLEK